MAESLRDISALKNPAAFTGAAMEMAQKLMQHGRDADAAMDAADMRMDERMMQKDPLAAHIEAENAPYAISLPNMWCPPLFWRPDS